MEHYLSFRQNIVDGVYSFYFKVKGLVPKNFLKTSATPTTLQCRCILVIIFHCDNPA